MEFCLQYFCIAKLCRIPTASCWVTSMSIVVPLEQSVFSTLHCHILKRHDNRKVHIFKLEAGKDFLNFSEYLCFVYVCRMTCPFCVFRARKMLIRCYLGKSERYQEKLVDYRFVVLSGKYYRYSLSRVQANKPV